MRALRSAWDMLREAAKEWSADAAPRLGAALAYYTVFSLPGLLFVIVSIIGLAYGQDAARGQLQQQTANLVGQDAAGTIQQMVATAQQRGNGALGTIVGIVTLLFGASGVFGELQAALDVVWDVEPRPDRGFWATIRSRFLSLTMVLGTGFLLLVSLVVSTVLARLGGWLGSVVPAGEVVGHAIDVAVSLAGIATLFAMLFKYLPDAIVGWREAWIGGAATAVLFVVGKLALGLYLGHANLGSGFGAAGSLIVILAWVYYSAQIFLFGAELTQVWARRHGARLRPAPDARPRGPERSAAAEATAQQA